MKENEEQENKLIPAEADEVTRFPSGSRVPGVIGGISEDGLMLFVPSKEMNHGPLFVNSCAGEFNVGDQGFATMSVDEKTKAEYWRFEYGN